MITAIIGHRGVGKTHFISRVKAYYDSCRLPCEVVDLDRAIEEQEGRNISDLFSLLGEAVFREIESTVFMKVVVAAEKRGGSTFIALGAGFDAEIPENIIIWWLRRPTDNSGRIFLDRPRIEKDLSPFEEYKKRYIERDVRFRALHHKQIIMSEGWDTSNTFEPHLFGMKPAQLDASLTITPEYFAQPIRLRLLLEDMLCLGVQYFELRDDLLSEEQIRQVIGSVPANKILISFRKPVPTQTLLELSGPYATDWASELGPSPLEHNAIVSLHSRLDKESVEEAGERLLSFKADHYKFSPMIDDFMELWSGHRFFLDAPQARSFLPRSVDGRWNWYRMLQKNKMKLNFVRLGDGSSADQPTVFDYLRLPSVSSGFAAVLGDPIQHSRTPAEHNDFFRQRNLSVFAIRMNEAECHSLNMSVLERLGMKAAAVTAPLKIKIRELCSQVDHQAEELGAVNTLLHTPRGWWGTNTDVLGLKTMFSTFSLPAETVVWGGGGTRYALRSILKGARFFSARKGEEIWLDSRKQAEEREDSRSPEVLIWALGRARFESSKKPPESWRPQYVIDLNYSEDSPGLELALLKGAKYISGKAMFKAQAQAQREFWQENLKS